LREWRCPQDLGPGPGHWGRGSAHRVTGGLGAHRGGRDRPALEFLAVRFTITPLAMVLLGTTIRRLSGVLRMV